METNVTTTAKKYFSRIGLTLFLGSLLIYAVQIVAMAISQNIPAIAENGTLSFLVAMLPMYVIAFPIIFWAFKKIPSQMSGEKQKMSILQILAAFCTCYALVYLGNIIGSLLVSIVSIFKQGSVNNLVMDITTTVHPVVSFLILVVCAPIMEELLFRKTIIDRTASYGEGISLVFSGLVFGLFHGNLAQFVYAFCLGIILAYIYLKTRNILYTIILHIMINFPAAVLAPIIMKKSGITEVLSTLGENASSAELLSALSENTGGLMLYGGYTCLLLCIVILGIILFFFNRKKLSLNTGEVTIEKGQRFKTMVLNVGMILYCIFWIAMIILQLLG